MKIFKSKSAPKPVIDEESEAAIASMINRAVDAAMSQRYLQRAVRAGVDKRSLRKTHRTAQFNFKVREDLKANVYASANERGVSIAAWMEAAIEAALVSD